MTPDSVGFYDLADELRVSVTFLRDMARAGKLETVGNRIVKESADELRWQLAAHRTLLGEYEDEQRPTETSRSAHHTRPVD